MTARTRLLVLLASAPFILFVMLGGLLGKAFAVEEGEAFSALRVFGDVVSLVTSNYVEEVDADKVMDGAMRGLAEGAGADSAYLSREQVRAYQAEAAADAGDIGVELTRQYYLRVVAVRDDSPAARAGLTTGDYLRAIGGKPTREMSAFEGQRLLRGAPGSTLSLAVIRGNAADPHVVEVTRAALPPPAVTVRMAGTGIGYVRIPGFASDAAAQVRARIAELTSQGATRLVIDVRSAAEGPIDRGIDVARLFVPKGVLAVREGRETAKETISAAEGDGAVTLPVVVLVDAGTSGPAEVFAAALAENARADLVGEHTQGRVTLQKLEPLPDGSGMLLSHAWYLTPSGTVIHDRGLTPTVEVEAPEVEFGAPPPATDPILEKALAHLAGAGA